MINQWLKLSLYPQRWQCTCILYHWKLFWHLTLTFINVDPIYSLDLPFDKLHARNHYLTKIKNGLIKVLQTDREIDIANKNFLYSSNILSYSCFYPKMIQLVPINYSTEYPEYVFSIIICFNFSKKYFLKPVPKIVTYLVSIINSL